MVDIQESNWRTGCVKYVTHTIEDECHFLFACPALQLKRSQFYVDYIDDLESFMMLRDEDKIKFMLQKDYIKKIGSYWESIVTKIRSITQYLS